MINLAVMVVAGSASVSEDYSCLQGASVSRMSHLRSRRPWSLIVVDPVSWENIVNGVSRKKSDIPLEKSAAG